MKYLVISLLTLAQGLAAVAQTYTYRPFPTDSTVWGVVHDNSYNFAQYVNYYEMKGDTVINGMTYSKIYFHPDPLDPLFNPVVQNPYCFLREDTSKKVFVKYPFGTGADTSEMVIYDFNLAIGDTFKVQLVYSPSDTLKFLVTSFSTGTGIDLQERRGTEVQPLIEELNWFGLCGPFGWTEEMGSPWGPFYNGMPPSTCGGDPTDGYFLSCIKVRDVMILDAVEGGGCDVVVDLNETSTSEISLLPFPNPVIDISTVKLDGKYLLIEIFDLKGGKVITLDTQGKPSIDLLRDDYPEGLYHIKAVTMEGVCHTGRFVVN